MNTKLSIDPRVCLTCNQTRTQGDFISDSGQSMTQCCYCASKAYVRTVTLTDEQFDALRAFADANGRNWKSKLNDAWSTGRYYDYNGTGWGSYLQQIRNTFGPSWFVKFSFDNVKTHNVKW